MNSHLTHLVSGLIGVIVGVALVQSNVLPITSPLGQSTPTNTNSETDNFSPHTSQELAVTNTVAATTPAVVSIIVSKDVPVIERFFEEQDPFGDFFGGANPFGPFSFQVPRLRQNGTERIEVGGGSGFLVSADGLIVTNRHVVDDETAEYTVFTNDGASYEATVLARDTFNDIAIVKIEGDGLPFLSFGDSDQLVAGQSVIASGNALSEFQNSVSVGVISGLGRSIVAGNGRGQSEQLEEVIQTDAAINPGNSGGPLLSLDGTVIGVNVAVAAGSENIGFALPSNLVSNIVETVQTEGEIIRPFLGVRYVEITPVIKEQNQLTVDDGVLIVRGEEASSLAVVPGSPADKAGLREGDIILSFDGQALSEETSLTSLIRKKRVGDTVTLTVLSAGQEKRLTVTLEPAPN